MTLNQYTYTVIIIITCSHQGVCVRALRLIITESY